MSWVCALHAGYTLMYAHILFIWKSTPLSINALLASSNHGSLRIRLNMTYLQGCFPRWVIDKRGEETSLGPQDFQTFLSWTPERSDNKFFWRNDSTVRREYSHRCSMLKGVLSPMNCMCKVNCWYWDEWSWFRSSLGDSGILVPSLAFLLEPARAANYVDFMHHASKICLGQNVKVLV